MVERGKVVSVGFLTQRDLEILGAGFTRHFPVSDEDIFGDLLAKLDAIEVEPLRNGVVIRAQEP